MKRVRVLLLVWVSVALLSDHLRALHTKLEPEKPMVRLQDVLLDLLGEGRTVLARLLWFKMDMIHEQLDDNGVSTFRQGELVPLLRMINFLDPYLADAYDTLAYELYRGHNEIDEAIDLVDEGLLFNPESWDLAFRRAFFAEKKKDWAMTLEMTNRSLTLAETDLQQLASLRCAYRCAVAYNNPQLGLQVLNKISQLGMGHPYARQEAIWRQELGQ